jgi:hypothetical protein
VQLAALQAELAGLGSTSDALDRKLHVLEQIRAIQHAQGTDEAHGFAGALNAALDKTSARFKDGTGAIKDFGTVLGETVAGPLQQFGEATATAMGAMIVGSQNAGQVFRKALIGALASVAKVEGEYFAAKVPANLAVHDYWAAGRNAAAATAMFAVSGAASALGGAGGGGGGGSALSTSTSLANSAAPGKLTVMWPGKTKSILDVTDPADQQAVKDMIAKLAGNRDIEFTFAG